MRRSVRSKRSIRRAQASSSPVRAAWTSAARSRSGRGGVGRSGSVMARPASARAVAPRMQSGNSHFHVRRGPDTVACMEFRLLGPVEVLADQGPVALGGTKPRAVLAVLLLNATRRVSADRLAVALWGEEAPAAAGKTVQVH